MESSVRCDDIPAREWNVDVELGTTFTELPIIVVWAPSIVQHWLMLLPL
jgi:hypothetical protein